MAKIIGEYRFVFVDKTESGKSNESLSSTIDDRESSTGDLINKGPANPQSQSGIKKFSSIASKMVVYGAMAADIYQTTRNLVYNRRATNAIISGNLQAARHLDVKKSNQDLYINKGLKVAGYVAAGVAIGTLVPGFGNVTGAVLGLTYGIVKEVITMNNQHREEMRRFMAELSQQRYTGYLESRRLVNLSGGVR